MLACLFFAPTFFQKSGKGRLRDWAWIPDQVRDDGRKTIQNKNLGYPPRFF
jgi:hypothetical protein